MTNITTAQDALNTAAAAINLPDIAGWRTPFGKIGVTNAEDRVAAFTAHMEAQGSTDKAAYVKVRDEIRAALRAAQTLQRARRTAERAFITNGQGSSHERKRIYEARIYERRFITWLLNARAAGKAWSAQAKAADAATPA